MTQGIDLCPRRQYNLQTSGSLFSQAFIPLLILNPYSAYSPTQKNSFFQNQSSSVHSFVFIHLLSSPPSFASLMRALSPSPPPPPLFVWTIPQLNGLRFIIRLPSYSCAKINSHLLYEMADKKWQTVPCLILFCACYQQTEFSQWNSHYNSSNSL